MVPTVYRLCIYCLHAEAHSILHYTALRSHSFTYIMSIILESKEGFRDRHATNQNKSIERVEVEGKDAPTPSITYLCIVLLLSSSRSHTRLAFEQSPSVVGFRRSERCILTKHLVQGAKAAGLSATFPGTSAIPNLPLPTAKPSLRKSWALSTKLKPKLGGGVAYCSETGISYALVITPEHHRPFRSMPCPT